MRATDNFFERKREWSRLKDAVLGAYLKPYLTKITTTERPVLVVDCFAGKGRFDDGEPGSPLIICQAIRDIRKLRPEADVQGLFIEKKYHEELSNVLQQFDRCEVLDGSFEEHIAEIGSGIVEGANILLFVDPYGIKSLALSRFSDVLDSQPGSLEIIMNFTTFGFLREGCHQLSIRGFDCGEDSDVYEDDPDSPNTIERMNAIAGGAYWQDILRDYHDNKLDMTRAEQLFAHHYQMELRTLFNHVVDIPVKYKTGHLPKYRLLHGTNSPDGLILMADMMSRTWRDFVKRNRGGQGILFDEIDYPDMVSLKGYSLAEDILALTESRRELKDLIVQLFTKYGITFSASELTQQIKLLAQDGLVNIDRDPPVTRKTGRPARSMDYNEYHIVVERVKSA